MAQIVWNKDKALLGWLVSEKHKEFLAKEFNGTVGAMDMFYRSKDVILKGEITPLNKAKLTESYDRWMEDFKTRGIKPNQM